MADYPTISPQEVHRSHYVVDEGYSVTDPVCVLCRLTACENGDLLKEPCKGNPNG